MTIAEQKENLQLIKPSSNLQLFILSKEPLEHNQSNFTDFFSKADLEIRISDLRNTKFTEKIAINDATSGNSWRRLICEPSALSTEKHDSPKAAAGAPATTKEPNRQAASQQQL